MSAASCFLTGQALEQIRADVGYSNPNVKLRGMSPGMAYGELGATHHSLEDIACLRAIDNITIVVPADPIETAAAMRWAAETEGPVFIWVSRMSVPEVYPEDYTFVPGKAVTLRDGGDVTLISNGTVLGRALVAAKQLEDDGVAARVICMPTVKPRDTEAVLQATQETRGIVTAEKPLLPAPWKVPSRRPWSRTIRSRSWASQSLHLPARLASCLTTTACPPEGMAEAARALIR